MQMKSILAGLICLVVLNLASPAQTTRTMIGGQTIDQYSNYTVPSYGYVSRYYENGVWRYYVNGSLLDSGYFGNLKTVTSNATFDLGKIGHAGRLIETDQNFALIWKTFRESHSLSTGGRFIPANTANTPAHKLALYEFAHYVSESRPSITISSMVMCDRCGGKRMRTGFTPTGAVGVVPCEDCNARGSIAKQDNYALIVTGPLPPRPTLEELIKEGLLQAPAPKAPTPPPAPTPAPAPAAPKMQAPAPVREPEVVVRELTPEDRYRSAKAKAEAGDSQAQYELGLFYSQDYERVVAIVDPPRSGLHQNVIRALRTCKPLKRLVYVSCNPTGSFLEDAVRLCAPQEDGSSFARGPALRVVAAVPVDLFPHTAHTELVVLFERD